MPRRAGSQEPATSQTGGSGTKNRHAGGGDGSGAGAGAAGAGAGAGRTRARQRRSDGGGVEGAPDTAAAASGASSGAGGDGAPQAAPVYSCGNNEAGQLGIGAGLAGCGAVCQPRCVRAFAGVMLRQLCAGPRHVLAVSVSGTVWSWGSGSGFKLGHGTASDEPAPRVVEALAPHTVVHVAAGWHMSAAVATGGRLFTWGNGSGGQLGQGEGVTVAELPTRVTKCLRHRDADIGDGSEAAHEAPVPPIATVSCGELHCAALGSAGDSYTWGDGSDGQLGSMVRGHAWRPHLVEVLAFSAMWRIVAGRRHTLAVSHSRHVYSWGCGKLGALGHNDTRVRRAPTQIDALSSEQIEDVSAGDSWSACLTKQGHVWWWGRNVAFGDAMARLSPVCVPILGRLGVTRIVAGAQHGMLVTKQGTLFGFGRIDDGALGVPMDGGSVRLRGGGAAGTGKRGAANAGTGAGTEDDAGGTVMAPTVMPLSAELSQRAAMCGAVMSFGDDRATTINMAACGADFTVFAAGIAPGDTCAAESVATGTGLVACDVGLPASFRIKAFTALGEERVCGGDALCVDFDTGAHGGRAASSTQQGGRSSSPPRVTVSEVVVRDHNTGVYSVTYVPKAPHTLELPATISCRVRICGAPIFGSPFSVSVRRPVPFARFCRLLALPPLLEPVADGAGAVGSGDSNPTNGNTKGRRMSQQFDFAKLKASAGWLATLGYANIRARPAVARLCRDGGGGADGACGDACTPDADGAWMFDRGDGSIALHATIKSVAEHVLTVSFKGRVIQGMPSHMLFAPGPPSLRSRLYYSCRESDDDAVAPLAVGQVPSVDWGECDMEEDGTPCVGGTFVEHAAGCVGMHTCILQARDEFGNNLRGDAGEFDISVRTPRGRTVTARARRQTSQLQQATSETAEAQEPPPAVASGGGVGDAGQAPTTDGGSSPVPTRKPRLRVPGARSMPKSSLPSTKSAPGRAKHRWRVLRRAVSSRKPKGKSGAEPPDASGSQTPVHHAASHRERSKLAATVRVKNAGDGTHLVTLRSMLAGAYRIHATLNGRPLEAATVILHLFGGKPVPAHCAVFPLSKWDPVQGKTTMLLAPSSHAAGNASTPKGPPRTRNGRIDARRGNGTPGARRGRGPPRTPSAGWSVVRNKFAKASRAARAKPDTTPSTRPESGGVSPDPGSGAGGTGGAGATATASPTPAPAQPRAPRPVKDDVYSYSGAVVSGIDLTQGGFVVLTARDTWGNVAVSTALHASVAARLCPACANDDTATAGSTTGVQATRSSAPAAASHALGTSAAPDADVDACAEAEADAPPAPPQHVCGFVVRLCDAGRRSVPAEHVRVRHVGHDGRSLPSPAADPGLDARSGSCHVVEFPWGTSVTSGPQITVTMAGVPVPGSPFWIPLPECYVQRVGGGYNTAAGIRVHRPAPSVSVPDTESWKKKAKGAAVGPKHAAPPVSVAGSEAVQSEAAAGPATAPTGTAAGADADPQRGSGAPVAASAPATAPVPVPGAAAARVQAPGPGLTPARPPPPRPPAPRKPGRPLGHG